MANPVVHFEIIGKAPASIVIHSCMRKPAVTASTEGHVVGSFKVRRHNTNSSHDK